MTASWSTLDGRGTRKACFPAGVGLRFAQTPPIDYREKVCFCAPILFISYFSGHFDTLFLTAVTALDDCPLSMP